MKDNETKMNIITVILLLCVVAMFVTGYHNSNMIWIPVIVAAIVVGKVGIPFLCQVRRDMKNL